MIQKIPHGKIGIVLSSPMGNLSRYLCCILTAPDIFPKKNSITFVKSAVRSKGIPKRKSNGGSKCRTGSLGQGMSISNGMALGARLDKKNFNIYSMHSDGEAQEGMLWEGAMAAGFHKFLETGSVFWITTEFKSMGLTKILKMSLH